MMFVHVPSAEKWRRHLKLFMLQSILYYLQMTWELSDIPKKNANSHVICKVKKTEKCIKEPDNPTSQRLPKMSFNGFSGDREGRKDKGGGERSRR